MRKFLQSILFLSLTVNLISPTAYSATRKRIRPAAPASCEAELNFDFSPIATIEKTYTHGLSIDGDTAIGVVTRYTKDLPGPKDYLKGILVYDLKNQEEKDFIVLEEAIAKRVTGVAVSPSRHYAVAQDQGGHLTLIDLQKRKVRYVELPFDGQTTAFFPNFYFSTDDVAFWVSQSGEVFKLVPSEFMSTGKFASHTGKPVLSQVTPYKSAQTRDYLIALQSGSYHIAGIVPKKGKGSVLPNSTLPIYPRHTSLEHNTIIGLRENTDGSSSLVEFNLDGLSRGAIREFYRYRPAEFHTMSDIEVSPDGSHVAVALHNKGNREVFVVEVKTGTLKLSIPNFFNDSYVANYQNRFIWPYNEGFVFARSGPQVLLKYNFVANEAVELVVDKDPEYGRTNGRPNHYVTNTMVVPSNGLIYIAPSQDLKMQPGLYNGNVRQSNFSVPNNWSDTLKSNRDGTIVYFNVWDEETKTSEVRFRRVNKSAKNND